MMAILLIMIFFVLLFLTDLITALILSAVIGIGMAIVKYLSIQNKKDEEINRRKRIAEERQLLKEKKKRIENIISKERSMVMRDDLNIAIIHLERAQRRHYRTKRQLEDKLEAYNHARQLFNKVSLQGIRVSHYLNQIEEECLKCQYRHYMNEIRDLDDKITTTKSLHTKLKYRLQQYKDIQEINKPMYKPIVSTLNINLNDLETHIKDAIAELEQEIIKKEEEKKKRAQKAKEKQLEKEKHG